MTTKVVVISVLAAAASPVVAGELSDGEVVVRADQVPAPARRSLQQEAGKNRIQQFTRRIDADGSVTYDASFHGLTTGDTEVEVSSTGNVVGVFRHLDEPEGTGP